jgi:hypothetical protein
MSNIRNAWGFTLFADDLRQEIGGKFSLIGIYQVDLIQRLDFPITLPKLAMLIKYYEVKGTLSGDLNVRIFLPGDSQDTPTLSWTIPETSKDNAPVPYEQDADSEKLFDFTLPVIISPLNIKEEGFVKVRIKCGDTIIRLGRLMIRKIRDTDNIQLISSTIGSPPLSSQSLPAAPAS